MKRIFHEFIFKIITWLENLKVKQCHSDNSPTHIYPHPSSSIQHLTIKLPLCSSQDFVNA